MKDKSSVGKHETLTKKPFSVFLSVYIRAKPRDVKQALLAWGQKYGLTRTLLKENFEADFCWKPVSHYIFNTYNLDWEDFKCPLLVSDEKQAYEELLSKLKAIDVNVELYSEWLNLTNIFRLQKEIKELEQRLAEEREKLEEEELRLTQEPSIHESSGYEELDDVIYQQSTKKIKEFLEKKRKLSSSFSDG